MSKISPTIVKHIDTSTYFKGDLESNGFLLVKAEKQNINQMTLLLNEQIERMDVFNASKFASRPTFDGDRDSGKVQKGRLIMHYNENFKMNERFTQKEREMLGDYVNTLGNELTEELKEIVPGANVETRFTFNAFKSIKEILDTEGPQVVHVDDDFGSDKNDGTYICLVAASKCEICVIKGSHNHSVEDYVTNKVSFSTPIVCHLTSCERLYMHIKLFHCGWTCQEDNIRFFYMLNQHHDDHRSQILKSKVVEICDGTLEKLHQRSLVHKREQKKKQSATMKSCTPIRFMKKSPLKDKMIQEHMEKNEIQCSQDNFDLNNNDNDDEDDSLVYTDDDENNEENNDEDNEEDNEDDSEYDPEEDA
jgi:hypothetical protein